MNFKDEEEKRLNESRENLRKLILIENIDSLGLSDSNRKKFIKFYYDNLDMNLLDALELFKKSKKL